MILFPLLLSSLTLATDATVPSLLKFDIADCEECEELNAVWAGLETQYTDRDVVFLDDVHCDHQEQVCVDYQITTFPTVLFEKDSVIREFEGEKSAENIARFINGMLSLVNNGVINKQEERLYLTEDDLSILGQGDTLIYFAFDEDEGVPETFVQNLREEIAHAQYPLVAYIINCEQYTDLCIEEPFEITSLPHVKIMSERIYDFNDDIEVEKVLDWVSLVYTYGVASPLPAESEVDEYLEPVPVKKEEVKVVEVVVEAPVEPVIVAEEETLLELTEETFTSTLSRYPACIIEYYTDDTQSYELTSVFDKIHQKYEGDREVLVGRVNCKEQPRLCKKVTSYPAVYHGFNGNIVREVVISKDVIENYEKLSKHTLQLKQAVKSSVGEVVKRLDIVEDGALVIDLDNYNETILSSKLVFVKFAVPWCGHCKKLKPAWKSLGETFTDVKDIVIGSVDCKSVKSLCKLHSVTGYPTLLMFIEGAVVYRHREKRDVDSMIEYVKEKYFVAVEDDLKYNDNALQMTTNNVWNVLGVRTYSVVLFTASKGCPACSATSGQFNKAMIALRGNVALYDRLMLATVDCVTDTELCKRFQVLTVPHIKMFKESSLITNIDHDQTLFAFKKLQDKVNQNSKGIMDVEGSGLYDALELRLMRAEIVEAKKTVVVKQDGGEDLTEAEQEEQFKQEEKIEQIREEEDEEEVMMDAEPIPPVSTLTKETFNIALKQSKYTFVKFYAPWCAHCKKLAPIWEAVHAVYHSNPDVTVAKLNCEAEEPFCDKFKVKSYPTLIMFDNEKKLKHVCKKRKEADILKFVDQFLVILPRDEL